MPIVTLKFKEKSIAEYHVEAGKILTIGRKAENDVVIENLAVSGYHAKIDPIGEEFFLTDLQSKNGSFVNEKKIISHRLAHGDVITIGKHDLVFAYEVGEALPSESEEDLDQTMVMDTNQHRAMLEKGAAADTGTASTDKLAGALSFLAGGSGDIGISKKLFKIGKGSQNDLVVTGFLVGQTAATISQRPQGYFLSYVGGMAKPKVNGKAVKDTIRLKEFDIIDIGKSKMQLVFKTK